MPAAPQRRLIELDGLRGLAALSVLLFHYTTKYNEFFGHRDDLPVSFPRFFHGVELFYIISGFVILMTISRTQTIWDFVASRFARLYPAYWVAILLTFIIVSATSLWPEGQPTMIDTALNFTMLQQFVGAQNVDGVYWTLQIELVFYAVIAAVFLFRLIRHIELVSLGLLALAVGDWFLRRGDFVSTPVGGLVNQALTLILVQRCVAFFTTGMMLYLCWKHGFTVSRVGIVVLGVLVTGLVDGSESGIVHAGFAVVVTLAALGLLAPLRARPFVFLGYISYTLYLLHQFIGYVVIHKLEAHGLNSTLAIMIATLVIIALATGLSVCVERPAIDLVRTRYRLLETMWALRATTAPRAIGSLTK